MSSTTSTTSSSHLNDDPLILDPPELITGTGTTNNNNNNTNNKESTTTTTTSLDMLRDSRYAPPRELFFCDLRFATKPYRYGSLLGRPSYCISPQIFETNVVSRVEKAEQAESECDDDENGGPDVEDSLNQATKNTPQTETSTAISLLRRLACKPRMWAIRFLGWVLGKIWRAAFTHVWLRNASAALSAVRNVKPPEIFTRTTTTTSQKNTTKSSSKTALVVLPTHRSHADYLLLSYIFFGLDLPVPLIAAGDNLNMPVVGPLLARGGAFFIRRTQGSPRYQHVLREFLAESSLNGAPVEFFIEGGRSRRGHVGKPKVGLLGLVIDLVRNGTLDDALLLPVSMDYDEIPEVASFASEVLGASKKKPETLWGTVKALISWMIWGKRTGNVYVGFSDRCVSVKQVLERIELETRARTNSFSGGSPISTSSITSSSSITRFGGSSSAAAAAAAATSSSNSSNSGTTTTTRKHHHQPPPLPIFRGNSVVSLSEQGNESLSVSTLIGNMVVDLQRECAYVTWGGLVSLTLLSQDVVGEGFMLDRVAERAMGFIDVLIRLGFTDRMPPYMAQNDNKTRQECIKTIEILTRNVGDKTILVTNGGFDARTRLSFRYSAATLILRVLPLCVAAIACPLEIQNELYAWLVASFDCEIDKDCSADLLSAKTFLATARNSTVEWARLVAPLIETLSATLSWLSTMRYDGGLVSEEIGVAKIREVLCAENGPVFPEATASLEIIMGLRSAVWRGVLVRKPLPSSKERGWGYELGAASSVRLNQGKRALDMAKRYLGNLMVKSTAAAAVATTTTTINRKTQQ
jgi:1-acyl-sn-glycerol-3-phosphate acyltransferase